MMLKKALAITTVTLAFYGLIATAGADELSSGSQGSQTVATETSGVPGGAIDQISWLLVQNAMEWLGVPYRHGGKSAEKGFDCSGFVGAVFSKTFGLVLPQSALAISKIGQAITSAELQIGDLIFFNTMRRPFSHVGIYLGEGRFIHASSTGRQIRVDSLDGYYTKRINGYRRITPI